MGWKKMSDKKPKDLVLNELKKITRILLLSNAASLEAEIAKVANTNARKIMWVLMNGQRMPKELADAASVTSMAASNFLKSAVIVGLIEYTQRKPPNRSLDYVPPSWLSLVDLSKFEVI